MERFGGQYRSQRTYEDAGKQKTTVADGRCGGSYLEIFANRLYPL